MIPVRNAEEYLYDSIESVMGQECDFNFEVIVVDDNSTDDSFVIANRFAGQGFKVLKSHGMGISDALNLGVQTSRGELIARHDADDIMLQGRLQSQFDFLYLHTDHVVLGGQIAFIGDFPKNLKPNHYPLTSNELEQWLPKGCFLAHPTVLFRKVAFIRVGGYRRSTDGAEDYDLWLRMSRLGKIANLNTVVTNYRIHENQVTNKKRLRTYFRTAKVRISWILNLHHSVLRSSMNQHAMKISKTKMLGFLLLESVYFVLSQIRRATGN